MHAVTILKPDIVYNEHICIQVREVGLHGPPDLAPILVVVETELTQGTVPLLTIRIAALVMTPFLNRVEKAVATVSIANIAYSSSLIHPN